MSTIVKIKYYLLFGVIFFIFSLCNICAQNESKSNKNLFAFGPKLSINFTKDNRFYESKEEFVPGADLGLFFRFNIARLYIQPEVNYVIRKHSLDDLWIDAAKKETNYIGVPLLVGVRAVDFRNFKIRFFTGPEFNFALAKPFESYFQLGFQAGLGFDIWRFTIDAGYSFLAYTGWRKLNSNIFRVGIGFKCY